MPGLPRHRHRTVHHHHPPRPGRHWPTTCTRRLRQPPLPHLRASAGRRADRPGPAHPLRPYRRRQGGMTSSTLEITPRELRGAVSNADTNPDTAADQPDPPRPGSRADRMAMPLARDVLKGLAEHHGVCVRPLVIRRTDRHTGATDLVDVPCGARLASKCKPCAERNRRLRIQQLREGWHLADERIRGHLDKPANERKPRRVRSTRRRADAEQLPRRPVEVRTVGPVYPGHRGRTYQPSTLLTVTLPSHGPVHTGA